tara:strand:- start:388 stop:1008 length:621 start_codon:yes stop_codon:yes gene_type:complete
MLAIATVVSSYVQPVSVRPAVKRVSSPAMAADKKILSFEQDGLFEGREITYKRPPVRFLSRLNELNVATGVSEAGLLTAAEDNGVFSTLEGLGAFSLAESLLPTIESLKLLSLTEAAFEVEAGLLFTAASFLTACTPVLLTLQICTFIPFPNSPIAAVPEAAFCLGTLTGGLVLFPLAFIVDKLQVTEDATYGSGGRDQPWFDNLL